MTGYDAVNRALLLLGTSDEDYRLRRDGPSTAVLLEAVNRIGDELFGMPGISVLSEEISSDSKTLNALVYGVAMLLALVMGSDEQNRIFARLYDMSRARLKSCSVSIKDVLPIAKEGC